MSSAGSNFLKTLIENDLAEGKYSRVVTRFPPEPNGFLHIGHAKAISVNFGLAEQFGGRCHLRFDDTNPEKEEQRYIDAIKEDVRWLGFQWDELFHASDYFEEMYTLAMGLVEDGLAYVDSQTEEEIRATRGTVTEPGIESPYRDRSVEENVDLFKRMRDGKFPAGAHVLRARIDMANANMKMRDPLLYRIRHATHPHTGDAWSIYPFYDYAHPLEDALEGVTHSFCTLEFENNREIYDWVLDNTRPDWNPRPHQTEFARLALEHQMMSKRRLLVLVSEGVVDGWDDPRMPTIAGLRRRGVTPEGLRAFAERVGLAKANSLVGIDAFEACIRDDLNERAPRAMAVLDPLEVVLDNYEGGEAFDIPSFPPDVGREGSRPVPFSRRLYIERDDFLLDPPKNFYRLSPGAEVRLRGAYLVTCTRVEQDADGTVIRVHCTYDPASRGGTAPDGRKVKGTLHWVSADHAKAVPVRLYEQLFTTVLPGGDDFRDQLNPRSLVHVTAQVEPSVAEAPLGSHFQFERQGYFFRDADGAFNRVVSLKDSWSKQTAAAEPKRAAKPTQPKAPKTERPPRTEAEQARFVLYTTDRGLDADDADRIARDEALADLFAEALAVHDDARALANWICNDLMAVLKDRHVHDLPFGGTELAELVALSGKAEISGRIAKDVFAVMVEFGGHPAQIVAQHGWTQVSDEAHLTALADELLLAFPDRVQAYRDGRTGLFGFFMGQMMQKTQGQANPQIVRTVLEQKLAG